MTPKEKAKELIDKYLFVKIANYTSMFEVKECALIAVDEIINSTKNRNQTIHFMPCNSSDCGCIAYWEQVKHEIEKL